MRRVTLAVAAALLLAAPAFAEAAGPTISLQQGALQGGTEDGIAVFRDIPFAAPPMGTWRWRAPQPPPNWTGTRDARSFGPICPQPPTARTRRLAQSEDCLSLNVWTPQAQDGAKLPVMVWIYGGSFRTGGSAMTIYDGTDLTKHGVIVVTFNYRVGLLGFLDLTGLGQNFPGEAVANYGLMDQIAALKWVRANIARFGGDPSNVTIFGESAGAMSVNDLMASPAARGLFAKAISESGLGLIATRTKARSLEITNSFAAKHDARGTTALDTLRALPVSDIVADEKSHGLGRDVAPEVDGTVIPDQVPELFAKGEIAKVPYLTGWNSNEASLMRFIGFTPEAMIAALGPREAEVRALYEQNGTLNDEEFGEKLFDDQVFGAGAQGLADFVAARGAPSYVYHFAYIAENFRSRFKGVDHAGEIPYVFGTRGLDLGFFVNLLTGGISADDQKVIDKVQDYWTNFAKTGDPNGAGLPSWPAFKPDNETMVFDNDSIEARSNFHAPKTAIGFAAWSKRTGLSAP
ncbi:MAG: carboxylesterase family protein [Alphaproteobacteria bacterium]|nr:carboxylesterase family protein [Alphaproteobacteria bacterium]